MEAILVKCPKWMINIPGWAVVPRGGWYSSQSAVCYQPPAEEACAVQGVRWCTMTQQVGQGKPTDTSVNSCHSKCSWNLPSKVM